MSDLYIMHYGVGHDKGGHSGRYPWGSGDSPYQDLSAAERRQARLDKYWYHKGAKIRLGVDHIRDVDPNTKLSDLFKYNKRTTSDVLADKILTYMYGDTEMPREELRRKKYNLMSAITAAEAAATTAILIKGLSSIKSGYDFIQATKNSMEGRAEFLTRRENTINAIKKSGHDEFNTRTLNSYKQQFEQGKEFRDRRYATQQQNLVSQRIINTHNQNIKDNIRANNDAYNFVDNFNKSLSTGNPFKDIEAGLKAFGISFGGSNSGPSNHSSSTSVGNKQNPYQALNLYLEKHGKDDNYRAMEEYLKKHVQDPNKLF